MGPSPTPALVQQQPCHPYPPPFRSAKSGARVGRIHTPHGIIDTPGFVAVGTNAALKAVDGSWADAGEGWGGVTGEE